MTKFIQLVKEQTCLYDVNEPLGSENIEKGWKQVSREIRFTVKRCHKSWLKRLEEYAAYIEAKEKIPLTQKLAEMAFVEKDLFLLLERTKILCSGKRKCPVVSAISQGMQKDDDGEECIIVEPMKRESVELEAQNITPHGMQQAGDQPAPQKRARRNAVDEDRPFISFDECVHKQTGEQSVYTCTANPVQPVVASSTPIAASERKEVERNSFEVAQSSLHTQARSIPTPANQQPIVNSQLNISNTSENLPSSLAAFGMYVATTLWKFEEKKRISIKGNIFKMLEHEEFGDC